MHSRRDDYWDDRDRDRERRGDHYSDRDRKYDRDSRNSWRRDDEDKHTEWTRDRHQDHHKHGSNDYDEKRDSYSGNTEKKESWKHWDRDPEYGNEADKKWQVNDQPSKSLVLRGLDYYTTEETISDFIKISGPFANVKIIRNKDTGESRGFAFVEFFSIDDASRFLTTNNGRICINGANVALSYSYKNTSDNKQPNTEPKTSSVSITNTKQQDWLCEKCSYKNFGWRSSCLTCSSPKTDACVPCGQNQPAPQSNILMIRGISPGTSQAAVIEALTPFQRPIQAVRFIRDKTTGVQRPFCFVEFYSIADALTVFHTSAGLRIEGNPVTFALADPQKSAPAHTPAPPIDSVVDPVAQYAAALAASIPPPPPEHLVPPIVKLLYDPSTGFYYDSHTGFYYDSNTGYFYDGRTQEYQQYDSDFNMFVPQKQALVNSIHTASSATTTPKEPVKKTVIGVATPKVKKSTVVAASKPLHFDELNAHPERKHQEPEQKPIVVEDANPSPVPSPEKRQSPKRPSEPTVALMEVEPDVPPPDFDTLMGPITKGLICVICQRKFENEDKLERHLTLSDLHKSNMKKKTAEVNQIIAAHKPKVQPPPKSNKRKGSPTPGGKKQTKMQKKDPIIIPPPTFAPPPPEEEHVGLGFGGPPVFDTPAPVLSGPAAKMMAMMGWKGGGLGKEGTGIVEPVKLQAQQETTGLGAQVDAKDSLEAAYTQRMKERLSARFRDRS